MAKKAVIKTTKYNRDVMKETDPRNFAFNSDLGNLSIIKIILVTGSSEWHGLGYTPLFMVLEEQDTDKWGLYDSSFGLNSDWYADKNYVYTTGSADAYVILFDRVLSRP